MASRDRDNPASPPRADGHSSSTAQSQPDAGRFAYDGLERIIHERARLSILTSLAANPQGLAFNDLKQLCHLTDGNLSRQLQALQESGFVEVAKSTKNNRPHTQVTLSDTGRERFLDYISVLESVVADALARPKPTSASGTLRPA